jgi:hypothetical protein
MATKEAKVETPKVFGVYQLATGSYTLGETKFEPLTPLAVSPEVKELACEETSPVKFFDTREAADKNLVTLKAKFDLQKTKQ